MYTFQTHHFKLMLSGIVNASTVLVNWSGFLPFQSNIYDGD